MSIDLKTLHEVFWSDICNTDAGAYADYCRIVDRYLINNGFEHESVGVRDGAADVSGRDCCRIDNDGCAVVQGVECSAATKDNALACIPSANYSLGSKDNGNCCSGETQVGVCSCRLSTGGASDDVRCILHVGSDKGVSVHGRKNGRINDTKFDAGAVGSVSLGGPNVERNRKNRAAKKMRKEKRQEMNFDWRRNRSGRDGFFSKCDESVQKDLRESRANLLIARNRRQEKEEQEKLKCIDSTEGLVKKLIKVTRMANQLKSQTADQRIGGWAQTVAESLSRSVAESAPYSVTSLEEVGLGCSALKSSCGSDSAVSIRKLEYEAAVKNVDDHFMSLETYALEDYESALRTLKDTYSDVARTPEENAQMQVVMRMRDAMANGGLGFERINVILETAGIDYASW